MHEQEVVREDDATPAVGGPESDGGAGATGSTTVLERLPGVGPAVPGLLSTEEVPPSSRRPRRWVAPVAAGAAALLVGAAVGGWIGADAADDQVRVDALSGQIDDLQGQVDALETEVADTREQAEADVAGARAEAESAAAAEYAARQAELDARSAGLDGREADLATREAAVTVLEQQAADGRIAGSGVHLVGTEVAPGTYRATDPEDCYWERRSGLSGDFDEIIANGIGAGDATVTIRAGDVAFSSERCGSWERIG
ncbi:hypothetical protein GCM10027451_26210 [Geodermatophilus aquaeductus]|uniref:hypothetical protein n=1 Tax=Geodermatophilus aquaeductus TaxID=1564161 RepID=UPI001C8ECDC4|nr:hypothetical protein [Geodermatophilus aquaeductus]